MANPLISQGSLNRIIASVTWPANTALNVTASFLGADAIRLALDGESTAFIPTLTGMVTSPAAYMPITLSINLLKTQGLAALYKAQMEDTCLIGDGVVRPDAITLPPYDVTNCAIEGVRELSFNGQDAGYSVTIRGYYIVNNALWD